MCACLAGNCRVVQCTFNFMSTVFVLCCGFCVVLATWKQWSSSRHHEVGSKGMHGKPTAGHSLVYVRLWLLWVGSNVCVKWLTAEKLTMRMLTMESMSHTIEQGPEDSWCRSATSVKTVTSMTSVIGNKWVTVKVPCLTAEYCSLGLQVLETVYIMPPMQWTKIVLKCMASACNCYIKNCAF